MTPRTLDLDNPADSELIGDIFLDEWTFTPQATSNILLDLCHRRRREAEGGIELVHDSGNPMIATCVARAKAAK